MPDEDQNLDKSEETAKQEHVEETTAESKTTEQSEHMIPKSRLDEEIQKRKDLEKRLGAIEKAHNEAETKRLKEQEDYKALYEKAEGELTQYKPKAERAESLETVLKETLDAELENIPQEKRALIPEELSVDARLRYISKNRALLSKAQPFDIGAGRKGGSDGKTVTLTPEEHQIASDYGMSDEEYAKYKDKTV